MAADTHNYRNEGQTVNGDQFQGTTFTGPVSFAHTFNPGDASTAELQSQLDQLLNDLRSGVYADSFAKPIMEHLSEARKEIAIEGDIVEAKSRLDKAKELAEKGAVPAAAVLTAVVGLIRLITGT